jgi:tripartite motif-containing protein 71
VPTAATPDGASGMRRSWTGKSGRRWTAGGLGGCLVATLVWIVASGASTAAVSVGVMLGSASPALGESSLSSTLVVPGMQVLDGEQQALDAERARHASPSAFLARVRSRTEFAHMGTVVAARVDREAFPALVEQHDGGLPTLPAGEKLRRFSAENVAQISLPDHERGVVESIEPMAIRTRSGQLDPVDLALKDEGASFTPISSQVAVKIPKHLGGGVRAPGSGVSLTPADGKGDALDGSEGSVDGASVLYANTQTDTDTLAKPTSVGFELSAILRSEASPHKLYYRLGLPSGATLVQHQQHSPVQVVKQGVMIGMVLPPTAVDAAGTPVPVTTAVDGDLLTVSVQDASGEYQYPVQVDPEYVTGKDRSLTGGVWPVEHPKEGETNWVPFFSSAFSVEHTYKKQYGLGGNPEWYEQSWYIEPNQGYSADEFAGLRYRTQGESTIYNLEMDVEGENEPSQTATAVEYRYNENKNEGEEEGQDNHVTLSEGIHQTRYEAKPLSMTSGYLSNPLETPRHNDVRLMDYTTQPESVYGFWTWIYDAQVYVAQEESKHPEVESSSACPQCGFNKASSTIAGAGGSRANVLYGSGTWLSPYQGAFEATAHDPGIGVSFAGFTGTVGYHPHWIRNEEGKCLGIQCPETYSDVMTYNESMPNGDDGVEFFAEDAAGMIETNGETVKVDASKPYNLGFTGMPEVDAEISAAPHKLTVHATDGKKPTPSSGIRSVSVSIDGGAPTELSGASCSEGECTASGEYMLDGESLSEGVHTLVVSAVSNSGEPETDEFLFDVRHASPVSVGPGSVDPTTGQFTLTASDVSLGGASGVSRAYQSRNLAAGASEPLGPQWAMSVGGGESLVALANGGVSVVSESGGRTTFSLNSKSEFESPKGDENLKMEYKATEHKYVLKDEKAGAETVFEQPKGTEDTSPQDANQFGAESSTLEQPYGAAIDSSGNVWVADGGHDRLVEFSRTGALIAAYRSYGSEPGQLNAPWGIAINQSTGNIYVTDEGNNRVDEFSSSGSFVRSFGSYGSGIGQLYTPKGIAINASGDVWVSDYSNDRIEEFSEAGTPMATFGFGVLNGEEKLEVCTSSCLAGKPGSGNGQFDNPAGLAFSGGNLYVSEYTNDRVQELSGSGTYVSKFGSSGSGEGQFSSPRGIAAEPGTGNLYVADTGNDRVEEFTAAGAYVAKFGSAGSGTGQFSEDKGIAVSSSGGIYVTDMNNNRVEEWTRSTWWPTSAKGALSKSTTYLYQSVTGSEGTSIEPSEVLAPTPEGVSCGTKTEELKEERDRGCHALTFKYATETTAKGENPTQWGEYMGHLTQVSFHAWNPSSKTMEEKAVAQYSYDKQGRLRAEWDPRVEASTACGKTCSALKTTYGYDTEGHVTALTPPGQQPWTFLYGTIAGDANTGRLLKVTRAHPKASWSEKEVTEKLHEQELTPKNTEGQAPKITGTPAVGVRLAASNGEWSGSPVAYTYQWQDCNTKGEECAPILGATNENYTPVSSDVGHTLVVKITATNGAGSAVASSAASTPVLAKAGMFTQTVDSGYSLNAVSCISSTTDCVLSDSTGKALYATNMSSSAAATWKTWSGPSGESPSQAVDCPSTSVCLLADGKEAAGGKLYYATSLGGAFSEAYSPSYGVDALSCASSAFCVDGQDAGGDFRYSTSPASTSWTVEQQGTAAIKGVFCLSSSFCALGDSKGDVHIATSTSQIESSAWKETDVDGSTGLNGVACTATISCVAVDGSGNALKLTIESSGAATATKHDIDGTTSLTAVTCTGSTTCVAVDSSGNVFVSKNSGESWTKEYTLSDKLTSVSCASISLCATVDTTGNVTAFNPGGGSGTEGEYHAPQPGSTIEYRVPVSGSGAPYTLSKEEVEKWGQRDTNEYEDNDPVEGMAVFAPDEPQSWPATHYTRATLDYINSKGLTVNTITPTGGIATTEYNELNEAVRTLDADNRATAMKEGCKSVLKKECQSAEVSEKLDTKTEYNGFGSEILKVMGPEHTVKLSSGEEVEARAVTHNYYDEDAKQAEEKNNETYNLITKTSSAALLANGEERDTRTDTISYNGQEDLGWKLRKPTSTTTDPAGLDLIHKTLYSATTGDVIETTTPASNAEVVYPPVYLSAFGSLGSGNVQFNHPYGVAVDAGGNVWVADTSNNRIEKLSSSGTFIGAYNSGTGDLAFSAPEGVAVNQSTGNVYVTDTNNNRIIELNSSGGFVEALGWGVSDGKSELEVCKASCKVGLSGSGEGELSDPVGVTIDSKGDIWLADLGNNRVQEFSEAGAYVGQFGSKGSGNGQLDEPTGVAISEGELYVVDSGNDRIEEFSPSGSYLARFGSKGSAEGQLSEPVGIAVNPTSGDLYVSDAGNERMQEFSPAGKFLTEFGYYGTGKGEFHYPRGVAISASGELYIADEYNARIAEWQPQGAGGARMVYAQQFGSEGSGNGQFYTPVEPAIDGNGNVWVTDYYNDRVQEFSTAGKFIAAYGSKGSGEVEFSGPTGMAVNQSTGNVYVGDCGNKRIEELNSSGGYVRSFTGAGSEAGAIGCPAGIKIDSSGDVWVADVEHNRIEEFSSAGTWMAAYGSKGSGELQFDEPVDLAFSGTNLYVADAGNDRIEELSSAGKYLGQFGSEGSGSGEFKRPEAIAADPAGNLYVVDNGNDRFQEFSASGTFLGSFASVGKGEGRLGNPSGIAINAAGSVYIADSANQRIEQWTSANQAAHNTKTIYYTAKEEAGVATCRNRPEWTGLVCQVQPVSQPDRGLPELPITTVALYNLWGEAEKTEEKFGTGSKAVSRTKTETYDPAGRALTSEETASPATDSALPKVIDEYNAETGAVEKQSTSEGTITSEDNTLGQLTEYKDASGNVAKYTYEEGSDGRLEEVSEGKGGEAKSTETYSYNTTTGFMEKLIDTAAGMTSAQGTFTARYDVGGEMTNETYPNNMTASYTINSVGQTTGLVYEKNADCASTCPETWFSDGVVPSIHGETLQQASSLAKESYAYDNAGRLLETQETPTGKGCVVRLYAYEEESNRTSESTREPSTEGKCAAEGGTVERHTYDEANRLADEGIEYETFGNAMKMPSGDAGGHEIVSTYYVDNQIASEEQNKQLLDFKYDPMGRTIEAASENKETKAKADVISHYAGYGNALTWTSEGTEKWTRNIPGIDGTLSATQEVGKAPMLQLHDLEGNIVGAVEDNETVTKLASTYNSTEFGVPSEGKTPPKYAWLGATGVSTETSFGSGTATQAGASYVPQVARALQTAPVVPPGAFPNGSPGTQFTAAPVTAGAIAGAQEIATQFWQQAEAERQKARENEAAEALRKCQEEGGCGAEVSGEEEYYYGQAQALAEEQEASDEGGTNATIASYKLRLSVGCLEAGFWTYCAGKYNGKWTNNKVETYPHTKGKTFEDVIRGGGAVAGLGFMVKGGAQVLGCVTAAAATPEDEGYPFLPLEIHCAASGFSNLIFGAVAVGVSIFG